MRKLSVGCLVDDGYQPTLIFDLIEKSKSAKHYSIDYLIVQISVEDKNLFQKTIKHFKQYGFLGTLAAAYEKAILGVESRIFVRDPKLRRAFQMRHLNSIQVPRVYVYPFRSTNGLDYRYREHDLESIKNLNIDVLVNYQRGNLCDEILSACEFGVISLNYKK